MRSSHPVDFTYKGHLQNVFYNNQQTDEAEIQGMLGKFRELNNYAYPSLPSYFAIDYINSSYKLITENFKSVIGFDSREFLDGGLALVMNIFHADDFKIYNEKVFTANLGFLKNTAQCDHHKHIFSYTFRVKSASGKYKWILQRGSYITSKETSLPLYSMGMVMDLTNFKTDTIMLHTIERTNQDNALFSTVNLETNYFYPHEEDALLTQQEKNVLKWIADGLSSKQLADKLFISEHTIISHRKNMLKKTNTKNVAELVAFSIRNRII
ncbi:MAG: regulatory protein LuxR [Mucilaginibacter sp.]|nr:regulatory protein LuxR [Mucilaginibacter sp.]